MRFEDCDPLLIVAYLPDGLRLAEWVGEKLERDGNTTISRVLTVQKTDFLDRTSELEDEYPDGVIRESVMGRLEGQYRVIRADVLGLQHDLKIAKSVPLSLAPFVAERGISIFGWIDDLVDEPIVVGGDEIKKLDLIVTMYLDCAELQAKSRRAMTMEDWAERLDAFPQFNERDLLTHEGKVQADVAKALAEVRYVQFDNVRNHLEAVAADLADAESLRALEQKLGEHE